jgi:hypothetical protein
MNRKYAAWLGVIFALTLFTSGCCRCQLGEVSSQDSEGKAHAYPHVLRISVLSTLPSLLIDYYVTYQNITVVAGPYGWETETLNTYSRDFTEAESLRWKKYIEEFPAGELSSEYDNPLVYDGESRIYYFNVGYVKKEIRARNASHELLDLLCIEVNRLLPEDWAVGRIPTSLLGLPKPSH